MSTETKTMEQMMTEFHRANGQLISPSPTLAIAMAVKLLRIRLMYEEWAETIVALHEKRTVDFADGLGDFTYVVIGTATALGLEFVSAGVFDALPRRFDDPATTELDPDLVLRYLYPVNRDLGFLSGALFDGSPINRVADILRSILEQVREIAYLSRVPLVPVFEEIHASNLTKRLGVGAGTDTGAKYAAGSDPKGKGYRPPNLKPLLRLV